MQREEKQLEQSLEHLINRVQDLKNSIAALIFKIEHEYETLSWPSVLDNFALLSGHLNSLSRLLKSDKVPALRNSVFLPYMLSPDRDTELEKLTEGRVLAFNHEVVPDYLRTKPEPEVEDKHSLIHGKASCLSAENAQKQINNFNKISNNLIDNITNTREEWEHEYNQKASQPQMSSQADTNTLIAAMVCGKGLKPRKPPEMPQMVPGGHMGMDPRGMPHHQMGQPGPGMLRPGYHYQGQPGQHMPKAPSTVKTSIRSAVHPYARP